MNKKRIIFIESTASYQALSTYLRATDQVNSSIRRGDLIKVYQAYPALEEVVIVDGVFEQQPSITHKEILWLINQGIRVVGIASLGALRAYELRQYGMLGFGWVYEQFVSEKIDGDDEVAVAYDPNNPVGTKSLAMVNFRYSFAQLGWSNQDLDIIRQIHFHQRHWTKLAPVFSRKRLTTLRENYQDIKKQDVLTYLALSLPSFDPFEQEKPFVANIYFNQLKLEHTFADLITFLRNAFDHCPAGEYVAHEQSSIAAKHIIQFLQLPSSKLPVVLEKLDLVHALPKSSKSLSTFAKKIQQDLGLSNGNAVLSYLRSRQIDPRYAYSLFEDMASLYDYFICCCDISD